MFGPSPSALGHEVASKVSSLVAGLGWATILTARTIAIKLWSAFAIFIAQP